MKLSNFTSTSYRNEINDGPNVWPWTLGHPYIQSTPVLCDTLAFGTHVYFHGYLIRLILISNLRGKISSQILKM